jgi:hypothetical protein
MRVKIRDCLTVRVVDFGGVSFQGDAERSINRMLRGCDDEQKAVDRCSSVIIS